MIQSGRGNVVYTLKELLELTNQQVGEVAKKSGYSRATVSYNSREVQDGITVRALRKIAEAAGAELVVGFKLPGATRFCECCGAMIIDVSDETHRKNQAKPE